MRLLKPHVQTAAAACVAVGMGVVGVAHGQTVTFLGQPPFSSWWASAVSDDGSVVVGVGSGCGGGTSAFRWSRAAGMQDLGSFPDAINYQARAVSNDGSTVVGAAYSDYPTRSYAFRWTQQDGMMDMGTVPGDDQAEAVGMSADGSVIVGNSVGSAVGHGQGFRWTRETGMMLLPPLPGGTFTYVTGVSRNGQYIIGLGDAPGYPDYAGIVWSGTPPTARSPVAAPTVLYPRVVNDDASVIIGGFSEVVRWSAAGGVQEIGFLMSLPGPQRAVSSNERGTVAVGYAGELGLWNGGFLWTRATGLVNAYDYFEQRGVLMDRWWPEACTAISADGLTVAGVAVRDVGRDGAIEEAFLVKLPRCGVSDFDHDGDSGTDADIEAFFSCLAGGCCATCDSADFDGDGEEGTDADIATFFRVLAGGGC